MLSQYCLKCGAEDWYVYPSGNRACRPCRNTRKRTKYEHKPRVQRAVSAECIRCGGANWYYRRNGRVCRDCRNKWRNEWRRRTGQNTGPQKAAAHRKHLYGITDAEYSALFKSQEGKCAVCGESKKLVVDHDHSLGNVRALTCSQCNVAAGMLSDSPKVAYLLAAYLEYHKGI